jgi:hypothetical protein
VVLLGCSSPEVSPRSPELASYLTSVDAAEIQKWKLDEATWRRITVPPYRELHAEYVREFDAAAPALAKQVGTGRFAVRDHFADDPRLTAGQVRARWALPVMAAGKVAMRGDTPIDAVFVDDGGWRVIVGLDRIVTSHVGRIDAACAARIDTPNPSLRCRNVSWQVADAALRNEGERLRHACSLANTLCGISSP